MTYELHRVANQTSTLIPQDEYMDRSTQKVFPFECIFADQPQLKWSLAFIRNGGNDPNDYTSFVIETNFYAHLNITFRINDSTIMKSQSLYIGANHPETINFKLRDMLNNQFYDDSMIVHCHATFDVFQRVIPPNSPPFEGPALNIKSCVKILKSSQTPMFDICCKFFKHHQNEMKNHSKFKKLSMATVERVITRAFRRPNRGLVLQHALENNYDVLIKLENHILNEMQLTDFQSLVQYSWRFSRENAKKQCIDYFVQNFNAILDLSDFYYIPPEPFQELMKFRFVAHTHVLL